MSRSETENKYSQLVAECDLLIKAGKINAVSTLISRLHLAQVPRPWRQSLAKICRRANLVSQGLRLLQPIIRHEKEQIDPPSAGEICEYSVLLSRNGSIQEALGLLGEVDAAKTPEASLNLAYCHIANWNYAKAVGYLEDFLASPADNYSKIIARVNLISAHLALAQWKQASDLLSETIPMANQAGASRLVGNCLELRSRIFLNAGDFARSKADLNQALKVFGVSQSFDRLLISKWQAINSALEDKSVDPLIRFKQEAIAHKQWESVREADLFSIKVRFDQKLLDYLMFGTPMAGYRQRIKNEIGGTPSTSFVFGNEGGICLDLAIGQMNGKADFNPGKKTHQVIAALLRDFYVPRNLGTLFSELYPTEYFDINSSPLRVRQVLQRTRQWLMENELPAAVKQSGGTYRFVPHGSFGVQIPLETQSIDSSSMQILQLRSAFSGAHSFTAKEACEKLSWPRSSFLVVVQMALFAGEISKTGTGKSTRYCLVNKSHLGSNRSAA